MDISQTPLIERIARVLAGAQLSGNAEGAKMSAGPEVDASWKKHRDEAIAVLKTMREPDERMANAGDPAIWEKMVLAAIDQA